MKVNSSSWTRCGTASCRKTTANQIFDALDAHEEKIEEKVVEYINDTLAMRRLTGYEWIMKQMKGVF